MLRKFLTNNRDEPIERCRLKVAQRSVPASTGDELTHGVALFLDRLVRTLLVEQTTEPMQNSKVTSPAGGGTPGVSEIGATAALHGRELLQHRFTADQVVHAYGDLCHAIKDLALERNVAIEVDEFRTLNRCLDSHRRGRDGVRLSGVLW